MTHANRPAARIKLRHMERLFGSGLVMWQLRTVQCGVEECFSVVIGSICCRGESHIASPTLGSFRMNTTQEHPSFAECSFDHRPWYVRMLSQHQSPNCESGTLFPVMFDYW